ncbi:MAG: fibronectin type III domain-containing protein [Eubacterium sp.]|nr:fibronectin type III domain-containing protein [Eubacterium sp.]
MKKVLKKVVAMTMTFTMAWGGVNYTKSVDAATTTEQWKENAVITPADGKLVGAGYIPVEFDNSMEGYTYTVLLDGKPMYWNGDDIVRTEIGETTTESSEIKTFTSEDSAKTEVYTTTVSKHEITVEAVKGGEKIVSSPREFYVSKKGIALGSDMTDKITMQDLNVSWYYNWSTDPINSEVDAGVDHVPMMWGGGEDNIEAMKTFTTDSDYILGFNEPDIKSQANMEFWDGVKVWNDYIRPLNNIRKVSPAPALPNGTSGWLKRFMFGDYICLNNFLNDGSWGLYKDYEDEASKTWIAGVNEDVDAVVLHYYQGWIDLNGLINAVNTLWDTYHKPVWVTEVSVAGMKGESNDFSYEIPERREQMAEFVKGMVNALEGLPYVERYCWFSYNVQSANELDGITGSGATAMFDYETGNYTELGRLYSQLGNPEGYEAKTITDDMMYVYVAPETTTPEETTPQETTSEEITPEATTKKEVTTAAESTTTQKVATSEKTSVKKVAPGRVKISKAKNVKKKSVKITLKKMSGIKKFEIQYATKGSFKAAKKKIVSKLTVKISKLKKGKTYFFRARAINANGAGVWSKTKKVKIRK